MIPKGLLDAATDPELRPSDLALYVFLHAQLDYLTYRPIKQTWITRHLQTSRENLSRGLTRLLERGYLELQGKARAGAIGRYRIPFSPGH